MPILSVIKQGAPRLLLFALALQCAGSSLAAETDAEPDSSGNGLMPHVDWRQAPPQVSFGSLVYIPEAWYTSETSWWVGGRLIHPFRVPGTQLAIHGSDVRIKGKATFKGQGKVEAKATINWAEGEHALVFKASYDGMPLYYYGLGPDSDKDDKETYTPQRLLAYVEYLHRVLPHLRAGLRYEAEHFQLLEYERGGGLELWKQPHINHTRVHGAGLLLEWDTRDRRYSPASGSFHQAFALFFDDELGSTTDFNNYNLDLRHYLSLAPGHVLAGQFFVYATKGNVPYWRYAALGGRDHTRAYRKGRFLDRILVATQIEYRSPFTHRLGYSLFAGVAEVAGEFRQMDGSHLQPGLGIGLRFQPKADNDIKARVDFAVGRESLRLDISLDESF